MPSARSTSGANSTEPFTLTISALRPVSSNHASATFTYFVATRTTPKRSMAAWAGSSPACVAHTIRQPPKPRSSSSYTSGWRSSSTSRPTMPRSAAPLSTYTGTSLGRVVM